MSDIAEILKLNDGAFHPSQISVQQLLWDRTENFSTSANKHLVHAFDVVVAADCLFLHQYHVDLLHVLHSILKPGGVALVLAPYRGHTFNSFVKLATEAHWHVKETFKYDEELYHRHEQLLLSDKQYNPDLHYPVLLEIKAQ